METRELRRQIDYEFLEMTLLLIKKSISDPNDEGDTESIKAVCECVKLIHDYSIY